MVSTFGTITSATTGMITIMDSVPMGTVDRLTRERDEARQEAEQASRQAALASRRLRELEAEVAMLRPTIEALNAERDRYTRALANLPGACG